MANKVSIIIPFYNAQDFLERSILSALNQTHESIELILVNNRSTDMSPTIANKFLDSKIFNVHLIDANDYQSHAYSINVGIEKSTGDFIYTLDADDYIEPDYIEILLNGFRLYPKALISVSSYTKEYKFKDKYEVTDRIFSYSYLDSFNEILRSYSKGVIPVTLWSKLYRKNVFMEYKLDQSFYTSDVPNTYIILSQNQRVVYNPSKKYHYYIRINSMSEKNQSDVHVLEEDISIIVNQIVHYNEVGIERYKIIKSSLFSLLIVNLVYYKKLSLTSSQKDNFNAFLNYQTNRLLHLKQDKLGWTLKNSTKINNPFLISSLYLIIIRLLLNGLKRKSK